MAEQAITTTNFSGGITTVGEKVGEENSVKFIKGLNIFESPDYITQERISTKVSSTTITGLPHWMVDGSPWNTNRYVYDSAGKIYTVNSSDSVSATRTVSGGAGEGLLVHNNALYYALATEMGKYYPLDNSPVFQDAFSGWWVASQLQDTGGGTGAADYVPPTSISEGATARQTFVASKDPITAIIIDVDVVGTGNWTVTLHDRANNSLGTSTIVNGSMSTGDVTFTLSSIARVQPGETYHFHVTSTVADGGVDTNIATDLEGAEYTIQYQALISATFHPMVEHLNGFAFGNANYIGFFDNALFEPNKVQLAPDFEVRSLAKEDEFVVALAWRGQSFQEAEQARLYYWDGISTRFNYFTDIKVGIGNALGNYKNQLIGVYGNRGSIYRGNSPFEEIVDEVPKLVRGKYVEVYPGAIDTYEGNLLVGYAGVSNDTSGLEQGVYQYGQQTTKLPEAFSFPFTISTGNTQATNQKISLVKSFGQDLYIGWRDDTSYGLDKITAGDGAFNGGAWESRIFDANDPAKLKQAIKVKITFAALTTGQSVTPKYDINRTGTFTTGTAASTVGDTSINLYINSNFYEIQWGFNLASSSNTFIKITSVNFIYDDNVDEAESA